MRRKQLFPVDGDALEVREDAVLALLRRTLSGDLLVLSESSLFREKIFFEITNYGNVDKAIFQTLYRIYDRQPDICKFFFRVKIKSAKKKFSYGPTLDGFAHESIEIFSTLT
uniref:Uncharacterized protein n=1 Tax=Glossina austeni TaxID=7395 RepID=A0A1A9VT40_GLOAU